MLSTAGNAEIYQDTVPWRTVRSERERPLLERPHRVERSLIRPPSAHATGGRTHLCRRHARAGQAQANAKSLYLSLRRCCAAPRCRIVPFVSCAFRVPFRGLRFYIERTKRAKRRDGTPYTSRGIGKRHVRQTRKRAKWHDEIKYVQGGRDARSEEPSSFRAWYVCT